MSSNFEWRNYKYFIHNQMTESVWKAEAPKEIAITSGLWAEYAKLEVVRYNHPASDGSDFPRTGFHSAKALSVTFDGQYESLYKVPIAQKLWTIWSL